MAAGTLLAALLTHAMLFGGKDLATDYPAWSYPGLTQRALLKVNAWWNHAHGFPSEVDCRVTLERAHAEAHPRLIEVAFDGAGGSAVCVASHRHTAEFLRFFVPAMELVCPTLGFMLFLALERRKPGLKLWRPLAIVVFAVALPHSTFWGEIARAAIVALAMMASVEMLGERRRRIA